MNPFNHFLLSAYYTATLPSRWRAARERTERGGEPVSVLFYHRVADSHPNAWTMPIGTFESQIRWLQQNFEIVDLGEAQMRISAGHNARPTVSLTFDDGYADNLNFAIPLLLRERIPFTYFVSTNHVLHGRSFDHDLARGQRLVPNTIEQLREMADRGVEIGAHTRNHVHLGPQVTLDQMADEIAGSKEDLQAALGRPIRYFAFPFGQPADITPDAFQLAYQAGYEGVCSACGGYNFPGDDPFHLRRIHADPELIRVKNWLTVDPRKRRNEWIFDPGDFRNHSRLEIAAKAQSPVFESAR